VRGQQLGRIEAKIDRLLHQSGDHEDRIRVLEARPAGLTPAKLWAGFVGLLGAAATVAGLVSNLN
jgi:hypothetical protein